MQLNNWGMSICSKSAKNPDLFGQLISFPKSIPWATSCHLSKGKQDLFSNILFHIRHGSFLWWSPESHATRSHVGSKPHKRHAGMVLVSAAEERLVIWCMYGSSSAYHHARVLRQSLPRMPSCWRRRKERLLELLWLLQESRILLPMRRTFSSILSY